MFDDLVDQLEAREDLQGGEPPEPNPPEPVPAPEPDEDERNRVWFGGRPLTPETEPLDTPTGLPAPQTGNTGLFGDLEDQIVAREDMARLYEETAPGAIDEAGRLIEEAAGDPLGTAKRAVVEGVPQFFNQAQSGIVGSAAMLENALAQAADEVAPGTGPSAVGQNLRDLSDLALRQHQFADEFYGDEAPRMILQAATGEDDPRVIDQMMAEIAEMPALGSETLGTAGSLVPMFATAGRVNPAITAGLQSLGSTYAEMKGQGFSEEDAARSALARGLITAALTRAMPGGEEALANRMFGQGASRSIMQRIAGALGEPVEEVADEGLGSLIQSYLSGAESQFGSREAAMTALQSLILGVGGEALSAAGEWDLQRRVRNADPAPAPDDTGGADAGAGERPEVAAETGAGDEAARAQRAARSLASYVDGEQISQADADLLIENGLIDDEGNVTHAARRMTGAEGPSPQELMEQTDIMALQGEMGQEAPPASTEGPTAQTTQEQRGAEQVPEAPGRDDPPNTAREAAEIAQSEPSQVVPADQAEVDVAMRQFLAGEEISDAQGRMLVDQGLIDREGGLTSDGQRLTEQIESEQRQDEPEVPVAAKEDLFGVEEPASQEGTEAEVEEPDPPPAKTETTTEEATVPPPTQPTQPAEGQRTAPGEAESTPGRQIEDFGAKIGGARKDLWAQRAMVADDLDQMNDTEMRKLVSKDKAFPKPDYQALADTFNDTTAEEVTRAKQRLRGREVSEADVGAGMALMVKKIRDSIQTPRATWSREDMARWLGGVERVRGALAEAQSIADLKNTLSRAFPGLRQSGRSHADWRTAQLLGGKFYQAAQPSDIDLAKAIAQAKDKGLPGSRGAWNQRYKLDPASDWRVGKWTTYRDGQPQQAYVVETPEHREVARAGSPEEAAEILSQAQQAEEVAVTNRRTGRVEQRIAGMQAAEQWAAEQAKAERKKRRKDPTPPALKTVTRSGEDYRQGRDVEPEDFTEAFGFRGVEFGNWNNQKDRQAALNYCYDALHDLARVVDVPTRALSLDGTLALAFGARGASKAAAHYEPGRVVINLTKLRGPGSLAHEWGHALDDYFARQSGQKVVDPDQFGASNRISPDGEVRPEVVQAWQRVMGDITEREKTDNEIAREMVAKLRKLRRYNQGWIARARESLASEPAGKRGRAATEEELSRFDALADQVIRGEGTKTFGGKTMSSARPSTSAVEEINSLHKEVKGRQLDKDVLEALGSNATIVIDTKEQIGRARRGELKKVRASDYRQAATEIDKGKRKAYWSTKHEMFARAFESYVLDQLADEGARSDYLVAFAKNDPELFGELRPYPEGDERQAINAAMEHLFATLENEETSGKNVRLFAPERELGEVVHDDSEGQVGYTDAERPYLQQPKQATTPRIPVAPKIDPARRAGQGVRQLKGVIGDLAEGMVQAGAGNPGLYGPAAVPSGTGGVYDPATGLTGIGHHGDLDATCHEIGHRLDHRFGYSQESRQGMARELGFFARWGSRPPANLSQEQRQDYERREGMSEFIRAWLVNPEEAAKRAPSLLEVFQDKTPEDLVEVLERFSEEVRYFEGLPPDERTEANIVSVDDFIAEEINPVRKAVAMARSLWPFGRKDTRSSGREIQIPSFRASLRDKFLFYWVNRNHLAVSKWVEAWQRQGVIDPDAELSPAENYRILNRLMAGEAGKIREMVLGSGLVDAQGRVVFDYQTGERMTFGWMIAPFGDHDTDEATRLMSRALAKGVEERVVAEGDKRFAQAEKDINQLAEKVVGLAEQAAERTEAEAAEAVAPLVATYREMVHNQDEISKFKAKLMRLAREPRSEMATRKVLAKELGRYAAVRRKQAKHDTARLAGIGGGLHHDYQQAKQALKRRRNDPEAAVQDEFLRRYRKWAQQLVIYAASQGAISTEHAQRIIESGQWTDTDTGEVRDIYMDFHRVFDEEESVALPTKRFRGSTRLIDNPLKNLLWASMSTVAWADRNAVKLAFVAPLRGEGRTESDAQVDLHDIGHMVDEERVRQYRKEGATRIDGRKVYTIRNNGEIEFWVFDPAVEASFEAAMAAGDQTNWWSRMMTSLNRLRKATITTSPSFLLRQPFRDTVERLINTETGSGIVDLVKGYGAFDTEDGKRSVSELYGLSGASFAGWADRSVQSIQKSLALELAKVGRDPNVTVVTIDGVKRGLEWLQEQSDALNRRAEFVKAFRAAKQKGMTDYEASLYAADKARGLIDFAEVGHYARSLNQVFLFCNPAIQGLRRTLRTAKGHPVKAAARLAMVNSPWIIGAYLLQLAGMSDKDREDWRQQPQYFRDFHWMIKLPGDRWLAIPKPYEYGFVSSGLERAVDYAWLKHEGRDEEAARAWEGYTSSFMGAVMPVDETAMAGALAPLIEATMNRDIFRQRSIVPWYEENKALEHRSGTARASTIGQGLQDILQVDARKLDHLIEGYLGGWGRMATAIGKDRSSDWWAGAMTGILKSDPAWNARDVVWVREQSAQVGKDQSKPIRRLKQFLIAYTKAEKGPKKRELREQAIEYAGRLRKRMERVMELDEKKEKRH